jgi:hypothetical protein
MCVRRDPALCVTGVAFSGIGLRENRDVARFSEHQRRAKSRDATTDDKAVGLQKH